MELIGMELFEWQKNALRDIFATQTDGKWAHTEVGALIARQNGKGKVLEAVAIAHLFLFPRGDNAQKTIIYTAHELKIAQDGFKRIRGYLLSQPSLAKKLKISNAPGLEEIMLEPRPGQLPGQGDRIKFIARTNNSGRGFPADVLILDEAQQLSEEAMDTLTNVQTTSKNMQTIFTGTVPNPTVNVYEVFEKLRDRGRANDGSQRTAWLEYSPEGADDWELASKIDHSDPQVWADANPSLIVHIPYENIAEMFTRSTSAESWARERLSVWPTSPPQMEVAANNLDFEKWDEKTPEKGLPFNTGIWHYAISVGSQGLISAICGAVRLKNGDIYIEHLDSDFHKGWVPARLQEFLEERGDGPIVGDGKNIAVLAADLRDADLQYSSLKTEDVASAYDLFNEDQVNGKIVPAPQPELRASFLSAAPRKMGQYGFTWESDDEENPETIAKAATLAYYAARTNNFKKKKPAIVRGW